MTVTFNGTEMDLFEFNNQQKDLSWYLTAFKLIYGDNIISRTYTYEWWKFLDSYLDAGFITEDDFRNWAWEIWPSNEPKPDFNAKMTDDELEHLKSVKKQFDKLSIDASPVKQKPPVDLSKDTRDVSEIKGIGEKSKKLLNDAGVFTVDDLKNLDENKFPGLVKFKKLV